jgi:hypothetical protein
MTEVNDMTRLACPIREMESRSSSSSSSSSSARGSLSGGKSKGGSGSSATVTQKRGSEMMLRDCFVFEGNIKKLAKFVSGEAIAGMRHDCRETSDTNTQTKKLIQEFGRHGPDVYMLCKKMSSLVWLHSPGVDSQVAWTALCITRLVENWGLMSYPNAVKFFAFQASPKNTNGKNFYAKGKDCVRVVITIVLEECRAPSHQGWRVLGEGPLLDESHELRKDLSISTRDNLMRVRMYSLFIACFC